MAFRGYSVNDAAVDLWQEQTGGFYNVACDNVACGAGLRALRPEGRTLAVLAAMDTD